MRSKMESRLKAQMLSRGYQATGYEKGEVRFRRRKWALRYQCLQFARRPEQSWAGFPRGRGLGDVVGGLLVRVQGTRGPVCCRAGRALCLRLGNLRASFPPTWLPCVSGWYGEPDARCLVFTSLTYLWPLIFEGLSCVPTLPSGPITICIVNQAPHPDTSSGPSQPVSPGARGR